MFNELTTMEESILMDQLAEYTAKYTQFLVEGGLRENMDHYTEIIQQLQSEIEGRKTAFSNNFTISTNLDNDTV